MISSRYYSKSSEEMCLMNSFYFMNCSVINVYSKKVPQLIDNNVPQNQNTLNTFHMIWMNLFTIFIYFLSSRDKHFGLGWQFIIYLGIVNGVSEFTFSKKKGKVNIEER